MKEETKAYIEYLIRDCYFTNPSAIVGCIFLKELEKGPHGLLRSLVIKEMDRVKKKLEREKQASVPERPKESVC